MFAFPTNMTEVFSTVGNLKNNKAIGNDGVSAVVTFFVTQLVPKCLKDAEVHLLRKLGNVISPNN